MTYVPNTPWVDGPAGGTPLSAARLNNIEAGLVPGYSTYVPAWTSTGAAPAIGNASVTARYLQIGKLVHAYAVIIFGSGSTFGTGDYRFTLPTAAGATPASAAPAIGVASLFDNSTAAHGTGVARMLSSTTMDIEFGATYLGTVVGAAQLAPWTWAQSDRISWSVTYEAA